MRREGPELCRRQKSGCKGKVLKGRLSTKPRKSQIANTGNLSVCGKIKQATGPPFSQNRVPAPHFYQTGELRKLQLIEGGLQSLRFSGHTVPAQGLLPQNCSCSLEGPVNTSEATLTHMLSVEMALPQVKYSPRAVCEPPESHSASCQGECCWGLRAEIKLPLPASVLGL